MLDWLKAINHAIVLALDRVCVFPCCVLVHCNFSFNRFVCFFFFFLLQDDTYTESYISTIGVDFVSIAGAYLVAGWATFTASYLRHVS